MFDLSDEILFIHLLHSIVSKIKIAYRNRTYKNDCKNIIEFFQK